MTVWLAIYEKRRQSPVHRIFATADGAENWRQQLAKEQWRDDYFLPGTRVFRTDHDRADLYFKVSGDMFEVFAMEVEERS